MHRRGGGGDEEDRTPDLRIANATLSQLSYVPTLAGDTHKTWTARGTGSGAALLTAAGGQRTHIIYSNAHMVNRLTPDRARCAPQSAARVLPSPTVAFGRVRIRRSLSDLGSVCALALLACSQNLDTSTELPEEM